MTWSQIKSRFSAFALLSLCVFGAQVSYTGYHQGQHAYEQLARAQAVPSLGLQQEECGFCASVGAPVLIASPPAIALNYPIAAKFVLAKALGLALSEARLFPPVRGPPSFLLHA